MTRRKLRNCVIAVGLAGLFLLALEAWREVRVLNLQGEIDNALNLVRFRAPTNVPAWLQPPSYILTLFELHSAVLSTEATNRLISIGPDVVPVLLKWSSGKEPLWQKTLNPVLTRFGYPSLVTDVWTDKQKAVIVANVVQHQAVGAVPELLRRLSDADPLVRRFSIEMLGAIGPPIGSSALQQMTNCLADSDKDVRNQLIWTFGQSRNVKAFPVETLIPVFMAGKQDSYPLARDNADIGLKRLITRDEASRLAVQKAVRTSGVSELFPDQPWEGNTEKQVE